MKRSKRIISFFLSLLILLSTINVFAVRHPVKDIPLNGIIVNDHIVYSDVYPYIKNSRTYVPIRFIAEELGYDVKWDGANKKVKMTNGSTNVELTIGSNKMIVNGKTLTLDAPAEIKDDRTFVPLRAIAESFGQKVDYSKDYKAVYIGDNPVYNKDYKVVYYFEGADPIITDYTINIVTYKIIVNSGTFFDCGSMEELLTHLFTDFNYYRANGKSVIGTISTYKTFNNYSSNKTTVNTNNPVRIDKIEDFGSNNNNSYSNNNYSNNKGYRSETYIEEPIYDIEMIRYSSTTGDPKSIEFADGTIKYVSSWDEVHAESRRILNAYKQGRHVITRSEYLKGKSNSDTSSYKSKNNKSYVDYLRSKNTDASDVL